MTVTQIEADATPDRVSRRRAGLTVVGCGATLVFPGGDVVGLRSDDAKARHFYPERHDWEAEIA
ncbi:hypothetical protein [Aliiruegeria lutimaris]|uniref:Uncharacterized protein n=1 Tax=Aliiruegeria lutimaris TaxID=571298 RepID=A0A1G8VUL5_9RHOB|nr:hypothetical protein [Aliiruegeria lutimaris]SDJ69155.1 hypothetical protein SAMN04488026_102227 [Aliiruegeria lutimaris]